MASIRRDETDVYKREAKTFVLTRSPDLGVAWLDMSSLIEEFGRSKTMAEVNLFRSKSGQKGPKKPMPHKVIKKLMITEEARLARIGRDPLPRTGKKVHGKARKDVLRAAASSGYFPIETEENFSEGDAVDNSDDDSESDGNESE